MTKKSETTEVATSVFGGAVDVADVASLANRAAASAANTPRGTAPQDADYLNFSGKRGMYLLGKDKLRIEEGSLWIVDIRSFEEGFVCWKGGKPAASRMANIYTGVPIQQPDPEELGPFDSGKGEGWHQAKAMVLRECQPDGAKGYLKLNSVSGVAALAELVGEFSERAQQSNAYWPVIALETEEFEAQGYTNYKPSFDVQGWLTSEQLEEYASDPEADIEDFLEQDEEKEPVPVAKKVKGGSKVTKPALTTDEEEEEEAPKAKPRGRGRARRSA